MNSKINEMSENIVIVKPTEEAEEAVDLKHNEETVHLSSEEQIFYI